MFDVRKYLNSLASTTARNNQDLINQFKLLISRIDSLGSLEVYKFTASDVILLVNVLKSEPQLMAVCEKRSAENDKVVIDGYSDAPRDDLYEMFGEDYHDESLESIQGILQNMPAELTELFASDIWLNDEVHGWKVDRAVIAELQKAGIEVSISFTQSDDVGVEFHANVLLETDEFYLDL